MLWKMIPNISATQVAHLHLEEVTSCFRLALHPPALLQLLLNFSSPLCDQ